MCDCEKPVAVFVDGYWIIRAPHSGGGHVNVLDVNTLLQMLQVALTGKLGLGQDQIEAIHLQLTAIIA